MSKKLVCCWDLEGPISIIDFAAEIGKLLSKSSKLNLQNYEMGEFFKMISNYDDYLIDVPGIKEQLKIPEYQPGDTLRLMAPLYATTYTDKELINLTKENLGLLPGSKELMRILHKEWEIFVISTSYTHFAHNVTAALEIPKDHVYCTELNILELKKGQINIEKDVEILLKQIFQKFLNNNKDLSSVIEDLNNFFWKGEKSDYIKVMNQVRVRGGKRKELAVEEISEKTGVSISQMIAIGDSITDVNMLQRLSNENGIAISFNGNRFSLKRANVAVTTPNSLGVLPIFQSHHKITQFLEDWESEFENFKNNPKNIPKGLISQESKEYYMKNKFLPEIANLTNKSDNQLNEIILKQEIMRKKVRGWAGDFG
ncbi:MAG: HAD hydrolase family protein [Candidatus Lokiarchaeota archaeon]|nr:HAD hydrolase family protein [Candidatus Lokiarchaeota archaeon]